MSNASPQQRAPTIGATEAPRHGVVDSFDFAAGLGVVRDANGADHPFHCTAIADGSRQIAPGTAVRFSLLPGHLGRFEGARIEALPPNSGSGKDKGQSPAP